MQRITIFANGQLPDREKARSLLKRDDYIICADGGTRHALSLGLTPHLVIGDMDSIETGQWRELEKAGVSIELFPGDKNETDLELAINRAVELGPKQILIIGALGGRLDQMLGNIALLSDNQLSALDARLDDGIERLTIERPLQALRLDAMHYIAPGNQRDDITASSVDLDLIAAKEDLLHPIIQADII